MRAVRNQVLTAVAKILAIGTDPQEQVVFDDTHLQQALDIGAILRYHSRRQDIADGWTAINLQTTHVGAGFASTSASIAPGSMGADTDMRDGDNFWVYGATVFVDADGTNIDSSLLHAAYPDTTRIIGGGTVRRLLYAGSSSVLLDADTGIQSGIIAPSPGVTLPMCLPDGASLQYATLASGAGSTVCTVMGRILPPGVPAI